MKKIITVVLVSFGLVTSAYGSYIKSDLMEVKGSSPIINGNRYADIDALNNPLKGSNEIFCVEGVKALKGSNRYDFYTIENTKYYDRRGKDITESKRDQLRKASWFADWYLNKSDLSDKSKAIAQIAIWNSLGTLGNYHGVFLQDVYTLIAKYSISQDKYNYVDKWAIAVSPGDRTPIIWGEIGQNFIVHIPETPEPATLLSFGIGLIFMTYIGRRNKTH